MKKDEKKNDRDCVVNFAEGTSGLQEHETDLFTDAQQEHEPDRQLLINAAANTGTSSNLKKPHHIVIKRTLLEHID